MEKDILNELKKTNLKLTRLTCLTYTMCTVFLLVNITQTLCNFLPHLCGY
jgi:hypothetical protein